jgi:hypothetical protein
MGKWKKVASVNDSKYGGYTLKIEADCELREGEYLTMKKPVDDLNSLVEKGIITEEQAEERLAKIPDFVKYNVYKTPPKG